MTQRIGVVDFLNLRANDDADAAGLAQVQFIAPADEWWDIDRAVVRTTSVATSTLTVYIGGQEPQDEDLIDGSTAGNLDVADNSSPWRVAPGQTLTIRWTGATASASCRVRLQGRILKRVAT